MMKLIAIDTETTSKSDYPLKKNGKPFGAWPFHPSNYPVLLGLCETTPWTREWDHTWVDIGRDNHVYCTCSGKFDLHYLRKGLEESVYRRIISRPIWDIQIAAYILSHQQNKSMSLEDAATLNGIPFSKDPSITAAFESGKGADEIEPIKVQKYLQEDVKATVLVAQKQVEIASPKQISLILQMGEAMKAIAEMEWNGMQVDKESLLNLEGQLREVIKTDREYLIGFFTKHCPIPASAINLNSLDLWSAYIFGGEYTFKWQVPNGWWQSGERAGSVRYKNMSQEYSFPVRVWVNKREETKKPGVYVVDEDVLTMAGHTDPVVSLYKRYKENNKLLNTYLKNMKANLEASKSSALHQTLNQCLSDTGRLSCSNPNLQNTPTDALALRACFVSRFKNGILIEIDWTALEMVGFATVNPDKQLIYDLNHGVDPHVETGKSVFGSREMTESERRDVKGVNFGTIYGGGAATISAQSGVSLSLTREIQKTFKGRYEEGFKKASSRWSSSGGPPIIESITGRTYLVDTYTKAMNYPVQGFSTGDLVPTVMGVLWRKLWLNNESDLREHCLTINQEHDKILFDCEYSYLETALDFIVPIMEGAPQIMKNVYGIDMPCGTPVKVKVGANLGSMLPVKRVDGEWKVIVKGK